MSVEDLRFVVGQPHEPAGVKLAAVSVEPRALSTAELEDRARRLLGHPRISWYRRALRRLLGCLRAR